MFLHYLGAVNSSNLLQITTEKIKKRVIFNKKWNVYVVIRLTGDRRIVFHSICSKCPPFICTHAEDACATRQLHCQWCSGRGYATLAADPVINRNRIKVSAVRWPKIRWKERRRCSRSRTVSCCVGADVKPCSIKHSVACKCAGALSCWKTKNSPDTLRITGSSPPQTPFDHIWAMVWSGARGNTAITAL